MADTTEGGCDYGFTGQPDTLQGQGGADPKILQFEVGEHEVTNQPQDGGSWNPKMGNPVGPK